MKLLISLFSTILSLNLACDQSVSDSNVNHSFENAVRRLAQGNEFQGIAAIETCTGFFLKNKHQHILLMTADHCFEHDPITWCENGGTARVASTGELIECESVVAKNDDLDPIVLKFIGNSASLVNEAFSLAKFTPKSQTKLQVFGYPINLSEGKKLVVTENCWVHLENSLSPFAFSPGIFKGFRDKTFSHNCSVFAGNSGGPMVVAGTKTAVGTPYDYVNYSQNIPTSYLQQGAAASLADFASVFHDKLSEFGVEFSINAESILSDSHLPSGVYKNSASKCNLEIVTRYYSGENLTDALVNYLCDGMPVFLNHVCIWHNDSCASGSKGTIEFFVTRTESNSDSVESTLLLSFGEQVGRYILDKNQPLTYSKPISSPVVYF